MMVSLVEMPRDRNDTRRMNDTNVYYLPLGGVLGEGNDFDLMDTQASYPWANETGANGTFALISSFVGLGLPCCWWFVHVHYYVFTTHPHRTCSTTWRCRTMHSAWTTHCSQALTTRTTQWNRMP